MEEKYICFLEYKRANWDDWQSMTPVESEEVAQEYLQTFQPSVVYWYRKYGNLYAHRRMEDGKLMTYRITRRSMVTEAEVSWLKERRAARIAKTAE
jgi:hypothetical protein